MAETTNAKELNNIGLIYNSISIEEANRFVEELVCGYHHCDCPSPIIPTNIARY